MDEKHRLMGALIGAPFVASVDTEGARSDKQNCALVVKGYLIQTGYRAYLLDDAYPEEYARNLAAYCPEASVLYGLPDANVLCPRDVIDVDAGGAVRFAYRDASGDNVLFVTNRCNSNCIMCPDSDANRKRDAGNRTDYLLRLIDLIPGDVKHITITGGEPTLLKWDLLRILRACKEKFPTTDFLMLSNGRALCVGAYRAAFLDAVPFRFRLAVPLYGTTESEHDGVTRSPGGFQQTMAALKALQYQIDIEIRIVVMKRNYQRLPEIARFIAKEIPSARSVSLMGLELLGNAARGRDALWVDFCETAEMLEQAVSILLSAGIEVRIYNYPLCSLPRNLWQIAAKSITDYKIRYKEACSECRVRELCGGFFFSTLHFEDVPVHPVLRE